MNHWLTGLLNDLNFPNYPANKFLLHQIEHHATRQPESTLVQLLVTLGVLQVSPCGQVLNLEEPSASIWARLREGPAPCP